MTDTNLENRLIKAANSHRTQRVSQDEMKIFRTCSWDIEATNLHANFGIMLCASIKPLGGKTKTFRLDDSPDYKTRPWDDSFLCREVRDELHKYMIVMGWNHVDYDLPFLNSRLIKHDLMPLDTSTLCMVDLLWASRYRLRLHSNRLESVIEFLNTKTQKTPLNGDLWIEATAGNKDALDMVVKHNIKDVESLEEVANRLSRFVKLQYKLVK